MHAKKRVVGTFRINLAVEELLKAEKTAIV